jgi:hypothetical protein
LNQVQMTRRTELIRRSAGCHYRLKFIEPPPISPSLKVGVAVLKNAQDRFLRRVRQIRNFKRCMRGQPAIPAFQRAPCLSRNSTRLGFRPSVATLAHYALPNDTTGVEPRTTHKLGGGNGRRMRSSM